MRSPLPILRRQSRFSSRSPSWPGFGAGGFGRGAVLLAELERGCRGRLALELAPSLKPDPEPRGEGSGPRRLLRKVLRTVAALVLGFHFLWIGSTSLVTLAWKFVDPSVTVLMAYRAWADGWKIRKPRPVVAKSLPSWIRGMLLSVEDYKFYEHHGFDLVAIRRAWEINSRISRPLYGGSTLSMQVARTLFLIPEKSYLRKYLEAIVTLELEAILGKDRILDLYFGYAEWGKGVFGMEAAARVWYGRGLKAIGKDEGARLIAILSSPIKYGPASFAPSLILRERYAFLQRVFLAPPPEETAAVADPGAEPSAAPPAESQAPEGSAESAAVQSGQPALAALPAPSEDGAAATAPSSSTN